MEEHRQLVREHREKEGKLRERKFSSSHGPIHPPPGPGM